MRLRKIGKTLLFPPAAGMIILLIVAVVFYGCAAVFWRSAPLLLYLSYALAAYTLTVWCCGVPRIVRWAKRFKRENRYARRWFGDARLRVRVSLICSLLWNTAYAVFQLGLGLSHHSLWFYSMAGYYFSLALMRLFLAGHTKRHLPGEAPREELLRYRACGIVFLVMNLALSGIIGVLVYGNRSFSHHAVTTITLAAYTFASLIFAGVNTVRYRKYNSPVYTAAKTISLAAACVSMLTLESTMLDTFGNGKIDPEFRRILLGVSGGVLFLLIISMALSMIVQSNKKLKNLKKEKEQL